MTGDAAECLGKRVFDTYYQAARAAKTLNRRNERSRGNAYKCPGTRHFHVGNSFHGNKRKRTPNRHTLKGYAENGRRKRF